MALVEPRAEGEVRRRCLDQRAPNRPSKPSTKGTKEQQSRTTRQTSLVVVVVEMVMLLLRAQRSTGSSLRLGRRPALAGPLPSNRARRWGWGRGRLVSPTMLACNINNSSSTTKGKVHSTHTATSSSIRRCSSTLLVNTRLPHRLPRIRKMVQPGTKARRRRRSTHTTTHSSSSSSNMLGDLDSNSQAPCTGTPISSSSTSKAFKVKLTPPPTVTNKGRISRQRNRKDGMRALQHPTLLLLLLLHLATIHSSSVWRQAINPTSSKGRTTRVRAGTIIQVRAIKRLPFHRHRTLPQRARCTRIKCRSRSQDPTHRPPRTLHRTLAHTIHTHLLLRTTPTPSQLRSSLH